MASGVDAFDGAYRAWFAASLRACHDAGISAKATRCALWVLCESSKTGLRPLTRAPSPEPIAELQAVLDVVSRAVGRNVSVAEAVRHLRLVGAADEGRRLQKLSKVRNCHAHPDLSLLADVTAALAGGVVPGSGCSSSGDEPPTTPLRDCAQNCGVERVQHCKHEVVANVVPVPSIVRRCTHDATGPGDSRSVDPGACKEVDCEIGPDAMIQHLADVKAEVTAVAPSSEHMQQANSECSKHPLAAIPHGCVQHCVPAVENPAVNNPVISLPQTAEPIAVPILQDAAVAASASDGTLPFVFEDFLNTLTDEQRLWFVKKWQQDRGG